MQTRAGYVQSRAEDQHVGESIMLYFGATGGGGGSVAQALAPAIGWIVVNSVAGATTFHASGGTEPAIEGSVLEYICDFTITNNDHDFRIGFMTTAGAAYGFTLDSTNPGPGRIFQFTDNVGSTAFATVTPAAGNFRLRLGMSIEGAVFLAELVDLTTGAIEKVTRAGPIAAAQALTPFIDVKSDAAGARYIVICPLFLHIVPYDNAVHP